MVKENLLLNSLSFDYPKEPVIFYFSQNDDEKHQSTIIKSYSLIPKEVRTHKKFLDFSSGTGSIPKLYTTFDLHCDNFDAIPIDFNDPDNEYLIKRYYHHRLERYFRKFDGIVVTKSGITNDLQVWIIRYNDTQRVSYLNESFYLYQMDKFTLKVKYDSYNHHPYILVSSDRPSLLMGITLQKLTSLSSGNPLEPHSVITPSIINKVMVVKEKTNKEGKIYRERRIERLDYLQTTNIPYDSSHTFVIVSGEMKKILGIDQLGATNTFESKYIKYFDKITEFKNKYLQPNTLNHIFPNLASEFTRVSELQIGQTDNAQRVLLFGQNYKSNRPQDGINHGPAINSPHSDIQLIAIYHQDDKDYASKLLGYFKNGNYQNKEIDKRNPLSKYIGSVVNYANGLHIEFRDYNNPLPEISERLKNKDYQNLNPKIEYVGIYVSPIHKYTNDKDAKECYYKIKELFLKHGIATQCVESEKMKSTIKRDNGKTYKNFTYTLQNMAVAICAKTGGSPWLIDTTTKRELVIGIGAFKSNNEQFIGAAFSFDNTGIFNKYNYFHNEQIDELVGAIRKSIIDFSAAYERPEKIVIHYYKQISRKHEYERIERMLSSLNLNIPVYIVTINKTESEDVVVFDKSSYFEDRYNNKIKSLMPYSGRWINLGKTKQGYRYLLCNNTRYEDAKFNKMDGFPFPIKLTIACPYYNDEIDLPVINLLLDQVYQFSRIYWKSVKQQGLPVTIKYPEMIAEIMPHFNNQAIYPKQNSLWFL